jgi:hypothetical protein
MRLGSAWAHSLLACGFWFALFSPWTKEAVNFWYRMLIETGMLGSFAR